MVWLTVKPFTSIIFSLLVHIFSCSDSTQVCTKTATTSDFSSCCIATGLLVVCQCVLLYCELYSKYPVLYSIGDFGDTHTHTCMLTVGRSAEEGLKAWHTQRQSECGGGESVNDDVIWEKQWKRKTERETGLCDYILLHNKEILILNCVFHIL